MARRLAAGAGGTRVLRKNRRSRFLTSDWLVTDTGFVNVIDDLAIRTMDPELLVRVGEKLAAAASDRAFAFHGVLWKSAFDGDRARIKQGYDSAIADAGPLSLHALQRDGYLILEGDSIVQTVAALTRAWTRIAAASGLSARDRIAEHYVRLAEATRKYRIQPQASRGAPNPGALGRITGRLDHRGEILVRHGPPDRVIFSPGANLRATETWVYDVPRGGSSYFTFAMFPGASGFVLMDDYLNAVSWESRGERIHRGSDLLVLDDSEINRLAFDGVFEDLGTWLLQRAEADPRYAAIGARFSRLRSKVREGRPVGSEIREDIRDAYMTSLALRAGHTMDLRDAITSQSVVPKFTADLPFATDLYQFRDPSGGSLLYAALATQLRHIQPSTGTREITSRVQLVVDTSITAVDTVMRFNVPAGAPETSAIGFIATLRTTWFNADGDLLVTLKSGDAGRQIQAKHRLRDLSGFSVSGIWSRKIAKPAAFAAATCGSPRIRTGSCPWACPRYEVTVRVTHRETGRVAESRRNIRIVQPAG